MPAQLCLNIFLIIKMSDFQAEMQRQMEILKSIETTLQLLSKSEKKQLSQYVNNNSKSNGMLLEKENVELENLSDIKRNLFGGKEEEEPREHPFEKKAADDDKKSTKVNTKRARKLISQVKQENITSKNKLKATKSKKLLKQLNLLRQLRLLGKHIKRYGLKN